MKHEDYLTIDLTLPAKETTITTTHVRLLTLIKSGFDASGPSDRRLRLVSVA